MFGFYNRMKISIHKGRNMVEMLKMRKEATSPSIVDHALGKDKGKDRTRQKQGE